MASTYLQRTQGTGTSRDIWTLSMWVKRNGVGAVQGLMSTAGGWNDGTGIAIVFNADDVFNIYNPSQGGAGQYNEGTRKYRDVNGWYHIVFRADSTQVTQADRLKIYVNGEQDTTINTGNLPDQNTDWNDVNNNGQTLQIGRAGSAGPTFFDGIMSHINFADGQSLAPTVFGQTDSTTGEWKIITDPSFTLGNNGFTILEDGNTITDQSSNSNNFTLAGGTLTNTEDCPSDVFATLNPLVRTASTPSFSQGNNTVSPSAVAYQNHFSTIGMTGGGKYYWEMKVNGSPNSANYHGVSSDIELNNLQTVSNVVGYTSTSYVLVASSGNKYNDENSTSYGSALASGDIMMGALDLDNGKIWFGKDGTWFDSGNPATGANPAFSSISASNTYFPSGTVYNGGFTSINFNFGNGYFGTTAISSEGTNASNIGKFEYDVPTGYTALSLKGINS